MPAAKNLLTIIRQTNIAFSGPRGEIDHYAVGPTKSGQRVTEKGSLRVAAIWIAVTTLADEIASLKMRVLERGDATRTPLQPPKLRGLWSNSPNADQTRYGIEVTLTLSEMLWGFSATYLGWLNNGTLDHRWPLDPSRIKFERMDDEGLRIVVDGMGTLENAKDKRPSFALNTLYTLPGQLEPVSPVRAAAELAGLSLAYEETSARLMGRGLNPAAVLIAGEYVAPDIAEETAKRLEGLHGGSSNAGKVAVVGGRDLKLERLTMTMADAEFIAQEDHVFRTLLAMWKVPPTVAGMVDKPSTWGTGVAEFSRGLERFTLRPIVERRQAVHEKFLTQWVDPALQVRYIFDSLLSASPKDRVEIQAKRLVHGMTSVERILAQEDEPPLTDDETVFSQLSLAMDEDRRLQRLALQADAYSALIRSGVEPEAAAEATGFDPSALRHTGGTPVTIHENDS